MLTWLFWLSNYLLQTKSRVSGEALFFYIKRALHRFVDWLAYVTNVTARNDLLQQNRLLVNYISSIIPS